MDDRLEKVESVSKHLKEILLIVRRNAVLVHKFVNGSHGQDAQSGVRALKTRIQLALAVSLS